MKVSGLSSSQVYKLISSPSSMPASLELVRLSYLRADIPSLHAHALLLEELLLSRNELPLTKYHALLALEQLLLTARYPALLFLEIYLCPLLADIALCLAHRRSDQELEGYFVERGYRESAAIKKLSHKFVHKAGALVILAAAIKPYQNVLQAELPAPSRFQAIATALREAGAPVQQEVSGKQEQALRVTFLREVRGMRGEAFGSFISKKLKEDIVFKQGISSSTRKLMESEDAVLSIPAINLCVSMLSDVPKHFQQQRAYLALFNSFVRQGHVYAIVVAHNASFITDIFREVAKVPGEQGLAAGRLIYPEAEASADDKLNFYSEFLKCLQIWAVCLPENEIGDESDVAKYYTFLREERMFVFPEMLLLRRAQEEFNQNLQERQLQNEEILRVIETDDKLMSEYARIKSSLIQLSLKMDKITEQPLPHPPTANKAEQSSESDSNSNQTSGEVLGKLKSLIREGTSRMEGLIYESRVAENMQALKSFSKEWSNLKENYKQELTPSIIQEGDVLKRKINEIYPLYLRLKKKAFSFNSFRNKVANILGFRLEDFGLQNFDDYAIERESSSQRSLEGQCNKTIAEVSRQSSTISLNLGCWSKLKHEQITKETPKKESLLTPAERILPSPPITTPKKIQQIDRSNQCEMETNEYGIRQLLIKRKQLLNASKQSIRSKISAGSPQLSSQIVPNHPSSFVSERSAQRGKESPQSESKMSAVNCSATSKRIIFSSPSGSSTEQLNQEDINKEREGHHNKMNVYEIYQIQIEGCKPIRQEESPQEKSVSVQQKSYEDATTNPSCSLRSRLYLQKIRYSSTRRAIEEYSRKVNSSNSVKSTQYNNKKTSRSIIHSQYKRIALQQYRQHESLSRGDREDSSQSNLNISLFSNQSKRQLTCNKATINFQKYSLLFPKDKSSKMAKNCLNNKGLLFSSEDIEVGFVHFRKENTLNIIMYLTPSKNALILQFQVSSSPQLLIHYDHWLKQVKKNKQEIIKLEASVKGTPFSLPMVKMKLRVQGGETKTIEFILPCTFNKFVGTKSIDNLRYEDAISTNNALLQTPKFRISNLQIFSTKISKFFSMPVTSKHSAMGTQCVYVCSHQSKSFTFKVLYEGKDSGVITGCSHIQHKEELQFLLGTLSFVLALFS